MRLIAVYFAYIYIYVHTYFAIVTLTEAALMLSSQYCTLKPVPVQLHRVVFRSVWLAVVPWS